MKRKLQIGEGVMEDNIRKLVDWMKSPMADPNTYDSKRLVCDCGMRCCHHAVVCKGCGGKFYLDPTVVTHAQSISNFVNNNKEWGLEKQDRKLGYAYAIYNRGFDVNKEEFREALDIALKESN